MIFLRCKTFIVAEAAFKFRDAAFLPNPLYMICIKLFKAYKMKTKQGIAFNSKDYET